MAEEHTDAIERCTYHAPTGDQPQRYVAIREAAKNLARVIDANCPESTGRLALRWALEDYQITPSEEVMKP